MTAPGFLLESSLRVAPLLGGALLLQRRMRHGAPESRSLVLLVSLLAVWALPFLARAVPGVPVPALPTPPAPAVRLVVVAWSVGALVLLVRVAWGLVALRGLVGRCRRSGRSVGVPGSRVRVVLSDEVQIPMAVGLLRPVVILPERWRRWRPGVRRGVLAHELAHLRRGDPWRRLLGALTRAAHWPNPLVWGVVGASDVASEEAADRAAVRSGIPPAEWARALLLLARGQEPVPTLAPGLGSSLGRRVEALVTPSRTRRRERSLLGPLAVCSLLLAAAVMVDPAPRLHPGPGAFAERWGVDQEVAELVLAAALEEGVDPALAFALVKVESGFDARRVSPSGAVGYTQILPTTAAALAPGLDPGMLDDPRINLTLGLRFLRSLLARFPAHPERAILAYGEGLQAASGPGDPLRVAYVQRVLRSAGLDPS